MTSHPLQRLRFRCAVPAAILLLAGSAILSPMPLLGQGMLDLHAIPGNTEWHANQRSVAVAQEGERTILRFSEGPGSAMAWTSRIQFTDGEIEFDVRGRDRAQQSFVGVAFHVQNDTTCDVVWLRPFNFVGADSTHHAHALQVASYPAYPWQRLRAESPGVYESALSPVPDPNGWVHVRIAVAADSVRVFIDRAASPAMSVRVPSGLKTGGVGLWVGDMSNGDFANVYLRPRS